MPLSLNPHVRNPLSTTHAQGGPGSGSGGLPPVRGQRWALPAQEASAGNARPAQRRSSETRPDSSAGLIRIYGAPGPTHELSHFWQLASPGEEAYSGEFLEPAHLGRFPQGCSRTSLRGHASSVAV